MDIIKNKGVFPLMNVKSKRPHFHFGVTFDNRIFGILKIKGPFTPSQLEAKGIQLLYLFELMHPVPRPNFEGVPLFKSSKDQSIIGATHYEPVSPEHLTFYDISVFQTGY